MRASLRTLFVALVLLPAPVWAVTAYISLRTQSICTYSNGSLEASATGGVGPYTFLWGGGQTTAVIDLIPAGSYSVTVTDFNGDQATANYTMTVGSYQLVDTDDGGPIGRCGAMEMIGVIDGDEMSSWDALPGPPPYTANGMLLPPLEIQMLWPDTVYSTSYMPWMGDGTTYEMTFMDGNGCAGTITDQVGYPVQWPPVTVLDVEGTCAGANSGSITFQTGLEGHQQMVQAMVQSAAGQMYFPFGGSGVDIQTVTVPDLPAGDYMILQFMSMSNFLPSSGCGDTTWVTVPDLGNTCGNLNGTAFMDYNNNCTRGNNETLVVGAVVEILPGPYYAMTNEFGHYSLNLPLGAYTAEQQSVSLVDQCNPAPVPFALTALEGLVTVNLADSSLIPLDAQLNASHNAARPGFQLHIALRTTNLTPASTGNTTVSLTFDPLLNVVSTSPGGLVSGNTVLWNQSAIGALQHRNVHVQLQVPPDINLLGTTLYNSATVSTTNTDVNLANNSLALPILVTGAYDPNDKVATTSSGASSELYLIDEDEWIDYTIRFQNTGTDTAFNIVITDTIAPSLDLSTFIAGAASHAYQLDIRDGNVLRWSFYNIQLPDSNVNEPRSHGFVGFRIRPRLPLVAGTPISNTANIYFDFNPPVITEPSVLTAEFSTGVQEQFNSAQGLRLHPNPASDELSLSFSGGEIAYIRIVAMDGREVLARTVRASQARIDLSDLRSGPYIANVVDDLGITHHTQFIITRP